MKQTGKYGLPLNIKYCKKCTRSNQRPAVTQEYLQTEKISFYEFWVILLTSGL